MKKDRDLKSVNNVQIVSKRDKFINLLGKWQVFMWPFFVVAIFLILIPIIFIFIYTISQKNYTNENAYFDLTLQKYIDMFRNMSTLKVVGLSLYFGLISSVIAIILAYPISYVLAGINKKIYAKNLWIIVTMPAWISIILRIIGLQCMFNILAPSALGTSFAIIVGMVYLFLPFAIIPITNSLANQDPVYYQAALDLKAGRIRAFIDIKLRYSMSGVMSAFNIVFIQAVTTLVIVKYIGNNSVTLIAGLINTYFLKGGNLGYAGVLSVFLVILVIIVLFLTKYVSSKFSREDKK